MSIDGRTLPMAQQGTTLSTLFHRVPCFHPSLFTIGIVRHILVAHRRQFTGSVFAGVSMIVRAVGDDLSVLVGQQLRREFFDTFRWYVQSSRQMGFSVAFRREGLDYRDSLLLVEFRLQVFGRNCAVHFDLLNAQSYSCRSRKRRSIVHADCQLSQQMVTAANRPATQPLDSAADSAFHPS